MEKLSAIELIVHPESCVEPLALEEVLGSSRGRLCFEIVYVDRYIRLYFVGDGRVLGDLGRAVKNVYGKVVVEETRPPSLRGLLALRGCLVRDEKGRVRVKKRCMWYAELRLAKPFYYPLVKHSEKKPVDHNPVDLLLSSLKPGTYVQICWEPEPGARSIIAGWVYEKKTGRSTSLAKEMLNTVLDILSPSNLSDSDPRYMARYEHDSLYYRAMRERMMLEYEREEIRQAQAKMAYPLYAVTVRIFADDPRKVEEAAQAFNQFHMNSFKWKVKPVDDRVLEEAEKRRVKHLGVIFKDKKLPVLSSRELALYVNLPNPLGSHPVRIGYVALEPPPELVDLGFVKDPLSLEDIRNLVSRGVILLGLHGEKGYGIPLEEFRKSHKAIFGTTGAGKSSFARYLMVSLLQAYGCGNVSIVYFDPLGDDAVKLVKLLPEECVDRLVYIDPATADVYGRTVRINFLEYRDERERGYVVESVIAVLRALYREHWGQRLERFLRMGLRLITSAPVGEYSFLDLYRIYVDRDTLARFLDYAEEDDVVKFFEEEYPALAKKSPEAVNSVLNKLDPFINNKVLRPFLSTRRSTVDLRRVLDEGGIVIVNLSALKGQPHAQTLFATLLLSQVVLAAYSRGRRAEAARKPVFIFIDEAHNFVEPSIAKIIAQMMAETRKFNVFLTVMSQYPQQLPKHLKAAVYELARQVFVFQVGLEASKELKKLFEPHLSDVDLINIDPYHYAAKVKLGSKVLRPFTLKAPYIPVEVEGDPYREDPVASRRIARSLELYGGPVYEERALSLVRPVLPPRLYVLLYRIVEAYRRRGRLGLEDAVRLTGISSLLEATRLLGELQEKGLLKIEGSSLEPSEEALGLFDYSTGHGGEWHRRVIEALARSLASKGYYVWVDKTGGEDKPDIVAIPARGDDWAFEETLCVEVEYEAVKQTTAEKLSRILRRCYNAGCTKLLLVVDKGSDRVRERLDQLLKQPGRLAIALGIPREWLREAEIRVEEYRLGEDQEKDRDLEEKATVQEEAKEQKKPVKEEQEQKTKREQPDPRTQFLAWLTNNLERLLAEDKVIERGVNVYITYRVLEDYARETGKQMSLSELAELLNAKLAKVRIGGKYAKAVKLDAKTIKK